MSLLMTRRFLSTFRVDCLHLKSDCRFKSELGRDDINIPTATSENTVTGGSTSSKAKYKMGKKTYFFTSPPARSSAKNMLRSPASGKQSKITQNNAGDKVSKSAHYLPADSPLLCAADQKCIKVNSQRCASKSNPNIQNHTSPEYPGFVEKGGSSTIDCIATEKRLHNGHHPTHPVAAKVSQQHQSQDLNNILETPFISNKPVVSTEPSRNVIKIRSSSKDLVLPSVSHILKCTLSPTAAFNLARWEEVMRAKLGEDGFLHYKNALLQRGKAFHKAIEEFLVNDSIPMLDSVEDSNVKACCQSIKNILPDLKGAYAIESHVTHSQLRYRGFVDCIAEYKGQRVVIEWKHSEKKKLNLSSTFDNPIQLMAYMGAINFDEHYPFQVEGCILVIAYTDGSPAELYHLSSDEQAKFWNMWLQRLKMYWDQQKVVKGTETVASARIQEATQQGNHQATTLPSPSQVSHGHMSELSLSADENYGKTNIIKKEMNSNITSSKRNLTGSGENALVSNGNFDPASSANNNEHKSEPQTEVKEKSDNGLVKKLWKLWKS